MDFSKILNRKVYAIITLSVFLLFGLVACKAKPVKSPTPELSNSEPKAVYQKRRVRSPIPPTYEQGQDISYRVANRYSTTFPKDDNVWVVTQEGKKRYGMPERWLDPALSGAELLAWRLEPTGQFRCHGEGESQQCVPAYDCLLEAYIKDDGRLTYNDIAAVRPWKMSAVALAKERPELLNEWRKNLKLPVSKTAGIEVMRYKRNVFKDLVQMALRVDCDTSKPKPEKVQLHSFDGKTQLSISIPKTYWQRVNRHQQKRSKKLNIDSRSWQGGRIEDTSLWVTTPAFAQQYGLPSSTIDNDLKGALAVAFRIEPRSNKTCGYFSSAENCSSSRSCAFDFYLPASARMAYSTANRMDISAATSSMYMHEQMIEKKLTNMRGPIYWGMKNVYIIHEDVYRYLEKKGRLEKLSTGSAMVVRYYRKNALFNVIKSVTLTKHCFFQGSSGNVIFAYTDKVPSRFSVGGMEALQDSFHTVTVPGSFMRNVEKNNQLYECQHGTLLDQAKRHYQGKPWEQEISECKKR